MFYAAELQFLQQVFQRCHLQTLILDPEKPLSDRVDLGFRNLLGKTEDDPQNFLEAVAVPVEKNTIYKLITPSDLCYLFFYLPATKEKQLFLIGPFLEKPLSRQNILEKAEKLSIQPKHFSLLEHYYNAIPVISHESHLFVMLDSFACHIFGGDENYTMVDLQREFTSPFLPLPGRSAITDPEKLAWNMQMMETRYAQENELMDAVSAGHMHKAETLLHALSPNSFENRLSDQLRNVKNYLIIMNTLLRKAAERGGVHPVYLDSNSSAFARQIEQLPGVEQVGSLMEEMFRSYCRLVKMHSMRQYSPPIQRVITYIDSDLTANLSLSTLAAMQNVSAGYLSSLFKQETGETLTEHVNRKRVKFAMRLLGTTRLQVQTIAQHCGILDVHYFSKVFKKYAGMTPKEYRNSLQKN